MRACLESLSRCVCRIEGEHTEHACTDPATNNADGVCHGKWIGKPSDDHFEITAFPTDPTKRMYREMERTYGVTTEAEMLALATKEMKS